MELDDKDIKEVANGRWSRKHRVRILFVVILSFILAVGINKILLFADFSEWVSFGIGILPLLGMIIYLILLSLNLSKFEKQFLKEWHEAKGISLK